MNPRQPSQSTALALAWRTLVTLAVVAPSLSDPLAGQIVRGQVMDSITGAAVAGSTVALLDARGSTIASTRTDAAGLFLVRAPDPGSYRLRVQGSAYHTSTFPPFELQGEELLSFGLLVRPTGDPPESLTDEEIIDQVCPDGVPDGQPVIAGFVRDAATNEPVPGARIRVATAPVVEFERGKGVEPENRHGHHCKNKQEFPVEPGPERAHSNDGRACEQSGQQDLPGL